jgi:outer membrane protein OmpA-like peptidoglycan-associated protein
MRWTCLGRVLVALYISSGAALAHDRSPPAAVLVFENGVSGLGPAAYETINSIATQVKADRATWVSLESYSEDFSSAEMNLALGQLRLDGIERRLELAGVPSNRIRCVNHGAMHPDSSNLETRRVEIRTWSPGY